MPDTQHDRISTVLIMATSGLICWLLGVNLYFTLSVVFSLLAALAIYVRPPPEDLSRTTVLVPIFAFWPGVAMYFMIIFLSEDEDDA